MISKPAPSLSGSHADPSDVYALRVLSSAPNGSRLLQVAVHLAEGCAECWQSVEQAKSPPRPHLLTTDPVVGALRRLSRRPARAAARRRRFGFAFDVLDATSALVFNAAWEGGAPNGQLRRVLELVWHLEEAHPKEKATADLRRQALLIRFTHGVFRDFSSFRDKLARAVSIESRATPGAAEPGKRASALRASVALYANPLTHTAYLGWVSELGQLYQAHGQNQALLQLYRQVLRHGAALCRALETHQVEAFSEWFPFEAEEVSA